MLDYSSPGAYPCSSRNIHLILTILNTGLADVPFGPDIIEVVHMSQESKPIAPQGKYVINGAQLLSVMDILENGIPCKFINVIDRVGSILGNVQELEIKPVATNAEVPSEMAVPRLDGDYPLDPPSRG